MNTKTTTRELTHDHERVICSNHPSQETGLRCVQCDRPFCTKCIVPIAVGQVCRSCARTRRLVNYRVSFTDLCVAAPTAWCLSLLLCAATVLIIVPLPVVVLYVLLPAAYLASGVVARVLDRVTRAKRGRAMQLAVGASVAAGASPVFALSLQLFSVADALLLALFAAVLVVNVMLRLR